MTTKKVLQFSPRVEKDLFSEHWNSLEKSIRAQAAAEGYEEEKVDAVCKRLKKYHEELIPLTEFKLKDLPLPEGLSEGQLVSIRGLFSQVESKAREQMSILFDGAMIAIWKLEFAWEIYRESDKGI